MSAAEGVAELELEPDEEPELADVDEAEAESSESSEEEELELFFLLSLELDFFLLSLLLDFFLLSLLEDFFLLSLELDFFLDDLEEPEVEVEVVPSPTEAAAAVPEEAAEEEVEPPLSSLVMYLVCAGLASMTRAIKVKAFLSAVGSALNALERSDESGPPGWLLFQDKRVRLTMRDGRIKRDVRSGLLGEFVGDELHLQRGQVLGDVVLDQVHVVVRNGGELLADLADGGDELRDGLLLVGRESGQLLLDRCDGVGAVNDKLAACGCKREGTVRTHSVGSISARAWRIGMLPSRKALSPEVSVVGAAAVLIEKQVSMREFRLSVVKADSRSRVLATG